uniref:Uncharacterized protein n=1 Tax=Meloidogyne hapla TaxID=6305 RepID=A0A1I8B1I7_MELHA
MDRRIRASGISPSPNRGRQCVRTYTTLTNVTNVRITPQYIQSSSTTNISSQSSSSNSTIFGLSDGSTRPRVEPWHSIVSTPSNWSIRSGELPWTPFGQINSLEPAISPWSLEALSPPQFDPPGMNEHEDWAEQLSDIDIVDEDEEDKDEE